MAKGGAEHTENSRHPLVDGLRGYLRGDGSAAVLNRRVFIDRLSWMGADTKRRRTSSDLGTARTTPDNLQQVTELESDLRVAEQAVIERDRIVLGRMANDSHYGGTMINLDVHFMVPLVSELGSDQAYQQLTGIVEEIELEDREPV